MSSTLDAPHPPLARARAVTVVALCYNHERFVVECLESIRAQTFQDFELVVTDDCSRDDSPGIIADWLARHRPDAVFIRHSKNAGLCSTLNEALAASNGEFISMVATDDAWAPDKLERQLAFMRTLPPEVAVVYSDAARMDESGAPLEGDFMQTHRPGVAPASGSIFPALADGNFIPAMSTLIRRSAIEAVGGYDERLTYEDYDMWLRLAARYEFAWLPGRVARYRIVSTSMVRTIFEKPNANHSHTLLLIHEKWMRSGRLSATQRTRWARNIWNAAHTLYVLGDPRARGALWTAFARTWSARALLLALASTLGVTRARAKRIQGLLGGTRD